MNIKSVAPNPILPIDPKRKIDANQRPQASGERDANGKQPQEDHEQNRHLNQQEFEEAIKALEDLPGLKANNLTVKVEMKEDCRVIYILDPLGKTVRRLSEHQLWLATRDKDRHTGKILDKAM